MLPIAIVAHSARGRARFKIADRRRQEEFFATAADRLGAAPGVERVEVNPLTGSILVHHESSVSALSGYAEANGLFRLEGQPVRVSNLMRQRALWADHQVRAYSGESLDLKSLGLVLLLGMGTLQLIRGQLAAPAVTVFWYAAALLATSQKGVGDDTARLSL
jgi:Heavy metal associated domain 2